MIKIAFVIDTIESPTAGTEKQLLMLIKYLDRSLFEPYLCVLRDSEWLTHQFRLCELFNADIHSFKKIQGIKGIGRLSRFFKEKGIDIVQVHFRDSSIAGILAAKIAKVNIIIATRRNQGYWYTPIEFRIQKFLNRFVSKFITNSETTKIWAIETEGLKTDDVEVIYNGLELDKFYKASNAQRRKFCEKISVHEDSILIGIVANLRPVKCVDVFIQAAYLIHNKYPMARFVVVGEGAERKKLERIVDQLNLSDIIRFLGQRQDVPDILACIEIGLLTSKSESFSNTIIEYMAASLAVVSTDVGGVKEALGEDAGTVVKCGDVDDIAKATMEYIDYKARIEAGKKGYERSFSLFSVGSMCLQYSNYYLRIENESKN